MAGKAAARNTDNHVCPKPMSTPAATPHGPGKIIAGGAARVFINSLAAAVAGDTCICPEPGNSIQLGSGTVFFGSKQAARQMDLTSHAAGMIQTGSSDVFIGG